MITIDECEWDGDQAIVTWYWSEGPGVPTVTLAWVEFEPADRSVGVGSGYNVSCDGPEGLESYVAEIAADRRAAQWDDLQEREYDRSEE